MFRILLFNKSTVADLGQPYIKPQASENRADIRWVTLTAKTISFRFSGQELMIFSTNHFSILTI